ncbi:MAG TPA: hypothetical protein VFD41_12510, partial [Actinomycetales bacterium]|nr:hypothetical protein [Actinomycetales bacterium]
MSARDDVYTVLVLLSELEQLLWPARRRDDPGGYGTDLGVPPPLPPTGVWSGGDDRRPITATYDEWVGRGAGARPARGPGELASRTLGRAPAEPLARRSQRRRDEAATMPVGPAAPSAAADEGEAPRPLGETTVAAAPTPPRVVEQRLPPPSVRTLRESARRRPEPTPIPLTGPPPEAPATRPGLTAPEPGRTPPPARVSSERRAEPRTRTAFARVELTPARDQAPARTPPPPPPTRPPPPRR